MKKILSLATTYPTFLTWDATPPFVHELNKRLVNQWLDIHVLAPRRPWTKLYEEQDGVKIHRFPYFFFSTWEKLADGAILPNIKKNKWLMFMIPFFLIMCFFNIIKLIAKEKIGIIHSHRIITNGFMAALYKKYINNSIILIITSHWWDAFLNKGIMWKIWNYMKRHTYSQIDTLTVVSNSIKELFQAQIIEDHSFPIEVIPMWVDHHLFSTEKYDSEIIKKYDIDGPFILFVWRLAEKKWIKYLIDAMPMIIKKFPKTKCLIVWPWPLESELKNQTNSLWLGESIIFTWAIPNCDLPYYYATSDVFVWPSIIAKDGDSEGFWLVFVEAIMSWAPVVWTNLLWIKDIIIQNKNWYLSHEKQSTSVSEWVIRLLNNNLDRVKVRETVLKFSWDNISKKYYDLLQKY